jgi:hypothetical protein
MYVRPDNPIPIPKQDNPGSSCRAWAYIGSANLSESAWYATSLLLSVLSTSTYLSDK